MVKLVLKEPMEIHLEDLRELKELEEHRVIKEVHLKEHKELVATLVTEDLKER